MLNFTESTDDNPLQCDFKVPLIFARAFYRTFGPNFGAEPEDYIFRRQVEKMP